MPDRPIRVLHVMPHIGVGGAERQLYSLITGSDPRNVLHEVAYYYVLDAEELRQYQAAGIGLVPVVRPHRRPLRFIGNLAGAVRQRRPDIVHCWLLSGGVWGRLGAIRAGARRIIAAYRNCEVCAPGVMRLLEWFTGHGVQHLANSRSCAEAVARKVGVPVEDFAVIYNGVESSRLPASVDRESLRREFQVPDGCLMVVMVGRLTPQKNYPMLLRLARLVEGSLPVKFVVVGPGELTAAIRQLARQLGLEGSVHFTGLRRDVPSILRVADIFCFTTWFEGFPNALLEAMAAGLPVVTTSFAGVDELVEDGVNGRIVPLNDANAAANALRELVGDRAYAARLGQAAAATVAERFSMEHMIAETAALYRRMLGDDPVESGEPRPW